MGEKTAQNLRRSIDALELSSKQTRIDLYVAVPTAERIVAALGEVEGVVDAAYAGSVRRFKEKIGDLDVLVATEDADPVTEAFLDLPTTWSG
jgi:DNA polymerase (family X)